MTASICRIYKFDKQFTVYDYLKLLQPHRTSSQKFKKHSKTRRQRPLTPLQTISFDATTSPPFCRQENKKNERIGSKGIYSRRGRRLREDHAREAWGEASRRRRG